ncbi:MAG: FAD-dependent oxidoreductase [Desulfobacterales bacterium]|nr:FAD-dependent oxidoreductase [Desulfobacterales bacterium]
MKFVVIGGDAAGMSAASRARRLLPDLEVTVLEMTEDVSYSACGMPYNIADPDRDIDDLVVRRADVFRQKQQIDLRTGHRADVIDPRKRTVSGHGPHGEPFTLAYDKLLIATGAVPVMPQVPGHDLPGVLGLKSLADGRRIKQFLAGPAVKRVVIMGMGYIALEMCEALRGRGIAVDMVKPRARFLPAMASDLAQVVHDELTANGVGLHLGRTVERIEETPDGLVVVCNGLRLEADMVLSAMGVLPSSTLAKEAGLDLGPADAVAVDGYLRTSDAHIYAAGDCADAIHVVTGQKTWIPLALRANRAGWAVADNVCGNAVALDGVAGTGVFKVFGLEVARTGLTVDESRSAGFDPVSARIQTRSRAHAHPGAGKIWVEMVGDRASGRLLGVQMVGTEGVAHRVNAPAVALHGQMAVARFAQSDLAYAPPFGPTWDPLLVAANQLLKQL